METQAVRELADSSDNCVISVGGGLPVRDINRRLLKELGIVVYLKTEVDELVKDCLRTQADRFLQEVI